MPVLVPKPEPKPVVQPAPTLVAPSPSVCPVGVFVSEPQERWENGTLQVILRVALIVRLLIIVFLDSRDSL